MVVLLVVLMLTACGGGNDDSSDSGGSGGTDSASELQGKLLKISDVPDGYVVAEGQSEQVTSEFCDGKFDLAQRFPPQEQAEVQFQKAGSQPLTGSVILELVAEYSGTGAQDAFNGTAAAVQECANFQQTDSGDGTTLTGQMQPIASFPGLGDETLAVKVTGQVTIQDTNLPVALEATFVRQGETVIRVVNGSLGPAPVDSQLTEELTETAFQKVF